MKLLPRRLGLGGRLLGPWRPVLGLVVEFDVRDRLPDRLGDGGDQVDESPAVDLGDVRCLIPQVSVVVVVVVVLRFVGPHMMGSLALWHVSCNAGATYVRQRRRNVSFPPFVRTSV